MHAPAQAGHDADREFVNAEQVPAGVKNEKRRQQDVQQHTDQKRHHRHARIAFGADRGVEPETDDLKNRAQQNNPHIIVGEGEHDFAGPEEDQQRIEREQARGGQHQGNDRQHRRGIAQRSFGLGPFLFTEANGNERRRAEADQHAERDQNQHEGKANGDAGDGVVAHRPAHEDAVDEVVQRLRHHAHDGRQRELHDQPRNAPLPQPLGTRKAAGMRQVGGERRFRHYSLQSMFAVVISKMTQMRIRGSEFYYVSVISLDAEP